MQHRPEQTERRGQVSEPLQRMHWGWDAWNRASPKQQAYPAAVSHPAKEFYTEQVSAYQDLESGCPDLGNQDIRVATSD